MDINLVKQMARAHRDVLVERNERGDPDTAAARLEESRALDQLWHGIESQCTDFCAAYNDAFGSPRLRSERHGDTVVIRALPHQRDTLVFSRVPHSDTHPGRIEAHRYHYAAPPLNLPVGIAAIIGGGLTLTFQDEQVTPESLVLKALSTFTEELAGAEHRVADQAAADRRL
jgi:hypothetical protein